MAAEQVAILVPVERGDELFQTQLLKVVREIMKELGDAGVVAIAVDNLAPEVLLVVAQLVLDVGKLRIELVVLLPPCARRFLFSDMAKPALAPRDRASRT